MTEPPTRLIRWLIGPSRWPLSPQLTACQPIAAKVTLGWVPPSPLCTTCQRACVLSREERGAHGLLRPRGPLAVSAVSPSFSVPRSRRRPHPRRRPRPRRYHLSHPHRHPLSHTPATSSGDYMPTSPPASPASTVLPGTLYFGGCPLRWRAIVVSRLACPCRIARQLALSPPPDSLGSSLLARPATMYVTCNCLGPWRLFLVLVGGPLHLSALFLYAPPAAGSSMWLVSDSVVIFSVAFIRLFVCLLLLFSRRPHGAPPSRCDSR